MLALARCATRSRTPTAATRAASSPARFQVLRLRLFGGSLSTPNRDARHSPSSPTGAPSRSTALARRLGVQAKFDALGRCAPRRTTRYELLWQGVPETTDERMFDKSSSQPREDPLPVIRTCRAWAVRTVAVHSSVDAHALHVEMADEAYAIGGRGRGFVPAGRPDHRVAKACGRRPSIPATDSSPRTRASRAPSRPPARLHRPTPQPSRKMGLKDRAKRSSRRRAPWCPATTARAGRCLPGRSGGKIGFPLS